MFNPCRIEAAAAADPRHSAVSPSKRRAIPRLLQRRPRGRKSGKKTRAKTTGGNTKLRPRSRMLSGDVSRDVRSPCRLDRQFDARGPTNQVGPAWARAATLRVAAEQTQDQRHDEQHQEDEEQHLRNFDGAGRNTPEAKQRRDERDHKKYDSVVQHTLLPCQEPVRIARLSVLAMLSLQICRLGLALMSPTQSACQRNACA